jgi:hypothetical protein
MIGRIINPQEVERDKMRNAFAQVYACNKQIVEAMRDMMVIIHRAVPGSIGAIDGAMKDADAAMDKLREIYGDSVASADEAIQQKKRKQAKEEAMIGEI